jgi:DNA-directed RNA polymerase subunit M/transcription elongation factor TFIIS
MEMGSKKDIERIEPQEELYRCPSCDYSDGFHVSFKVGKMDKKAEVYLICPNCHRRFRMGWTVSMSP